MSRYASLVVRPAAAFLALAALALAAAACGSDEPARVEGLARVKIGSLVVQAEVVEGDLLYKGLSGRDSLAADRGMLFNFPAPGPHSIWMKDMRFPIDIIWISEDGRVVDIEAGAPPPAPGTADADLPIYQPAEVDAYVLEVNAGLAAEAGVQVGDRVEIELP